MPQRFTLDRKSFEEFLAAASFLQQVQRQALRDGAGALHGAQPLLVLMETQRAIELGKLDLDSAMERIVGLTPRTVGASGAAVWLFTRNEFVCGASTGISPKDERLRLQVLSRLVREFHVGSLPEVAKLAKIDSGDYPGSVKSFLVTPIYQGSRIAGALAAFSSELDPFTDRDAANLRLLASLLARALATATEAGLQKVEALERTAVLQLVEQVAPALRELAELAEQTPEVLAEAGPVAVGGPLETPDVDPELVAAGEIGTYVPAESSEARELTRDDDPSQQQAEPPEEDIWVPFVGVRASLGSEFDRPSRVWSWLQDRWQRGTESARRQVAAVMRGFGRVGSQISSYAQSVIGKMGRAARYRPVLPTFPAARRGMDQMQSSTMRIVQRAWTQLRHAVEKLPEPRGLPRRSLHLRWVETRLWFREVRDRAGIKLRSLSRRVNQFASRLDLSNLREADAQKHLRAVEAALLNAVERTGARLEAAAQYQVRIRLSLPRFSLSRSAVQKSAPAWVVLAIMISFLALELGLLRSLTIGAIEPETSSSASAPPVTAITEGGNQDARLDSARVRSATAAQTSSKAADLEGSHRQITDRAAEAYVSDMTRFEIAALRRRAEYGDDAAAFQLGMAYEIGHGVSQNCVKAAQWVMQSADDGNAAAEYNLGLRYRDGDGIDPDPQEANKWLRRAFAHKYSGAKVALLAMNSR